VQNNSLSSVTSFNHSSCKQREWNKNKVWILIKVSTRNGNVVTYITKPMFVILRTFPSHHTWWYLIQNVAPHVQCTHFIWACVFCFFLWWLIYAMSYKRVFGAKTRKVVTRKPVKWWFWRVFAWRPFAPPGKDTTNKMRKGDARKVSYFRVAGRKVAMRKHEKVTIWRVFAWRLFAYSPRKHDYTTWHKSATIFFLFRVILFS